MFRSGVFTSRATCTPRDLELEQRINRKLKSGRVSCFTMKGDPDDYYGVTYSLRGLSKTHMRKEFDVDDNDLIEGLNITARGMENTKLPPGYTYDEDDAERFPQWVQDLINDG